jgi:membrane protein DedA with SNARE-associated domain
VETWFAGKPFWIAFLALFGIVLARAQLTYWAGRGVIAGTLRTRLAERLQSPKAVRVSAALNRWGAPLVTVSFLTIGFQTVVNAAAGLNRMPWPRYTLAMIPGCIAWAALYATVGMAVITGWLTLAARNPWVHWVLGALLLGLVVWLIARSRLRRRSEPLAEVEPSL